jgi:uncharacterized membrane protein
VSDAISAMVASEMAVAFHLVWFALWMLINTGYIRGVRPFDPYPFSLLTMIVSPEAIFLTLFVLASQNRLTREADRRAHLDLQVNLLSEQEMTMVLRMLGEICEHFQLRIPSRPRNIRSSPAAPMSGSSLSAFMRRKSSVR